MYHRAGPAGSDPELANRVSVADVRPQQLDSDRTGKLKVGSLPDLGGVVAGELAVQPVPAGDHDCGADQRHRPASTPHRAS
jgi:hypothetical protein